MLGLFGTLDLASRSLATQQEAMTVASQNMANVNNPAYAVEQAVIQDSAPINTPIGEEGTGVDIAAISESRNNLLDSQIVAENGTTSSFSTQQAALQNAEAFLGEQLSSASSTSGSSATSTGGLAAMLSSLFNSFSSMTTGSGNPATVVQYARQVAGQFNQVSASLSQVRSNLNSTIVSNVNACNQDLNQIATLNQQILQAQAGGGNANQLVDQRQQIVENLSNLINTSTAIESNGTMDVWAGGAAVVQGSTLIDALHVNDGGNGWFYITDTGSHVQLSVTGGSIGGALSTRDGALSSLQTSLDTLASQLITQVNNTYSTGYSSSGATGQNLFTGTNAATIAVNSTLVADPSQFQGSSVAGATGDNQIALALANLADQTNPALGNQSFIQYYSQTVANLGTAIQSATDQLATSQAVSTSLTNQRSSQSGVSIDAEMTNLLQFQKAYEASAKIVNTLDYMMDTVINMKYIS